MVIAVGMLLTQYIEIVNNFTYIPKIIVRFFLRNIFVVYFSQVHKQQHCNL
jgi:hypothetical protein